MLTRSPIKRTAPLRRSTGEASASVPVKRQRKCAICREPATSAMNLKPFCSPGCALALAQRVIAKQDRATTKEKLLALKPLSHWKRAAQAALNAWIVKGRDAGLPCISCGAPPADDDQAGHFLTRGAHPALALEPANLARQCLRCNLFLHGNQARYRVGLVERIGLAEVERLEGPQQPRHWTADALRELAADYRAKLRALKRAAT